MTTTIVELVMSYLKIHLTLLVIEEFTNVIHFYSVVHLLPMNGFTLAVLDE